MVRPVKSSVLESAIHREARSNAGFLYLRAEQSIDPIKEDYAASDETGLPTRYKGSVSKDDIKDHLEEMAESSEVRMIRDGTVYFYNPFKLPGEESQKLFNTIKEIFDEKRYFTRQDLVEYLRGADIHIAEDDVGAFINELRERDLLKKLEGQTAYYRPGQDLRENTDLRGRSEIIQDGANDDGCITHAELENVLDIDKITEEIKTDLTEDGVLHELDGKYLVNSKDCHSDFVESLAENKLARPIRESFKSSDWVKTESEFETDLRNQITQKSNVLSVVEDGDLYYEIKEQVENILELQEEKIEEGGTHVPIYKIEEKLEEFIEDEAEAIVNDVQNSIDNEDPPSMEVALEGIDMPTYGSESVTKSYVRERVLDQVRTEVDENDEINIWSTIEG
jgi:hypothetical protein